MKVGELIRLLEEDGWRLARTRGSHRQYKKREQTRYRNGGWEAGLGRATRDVKRDPEAGGPEEGREWRMTRYMVVVERGATSWGAHVPDLPGCVAVGETRAEALRLIREAIELHIEGLKQDGAPVPPPSSEGEIVEIGAA
jgi:predicted RNase H-like HicB family nuclease